GAAQECYQKALTLHPDDLGSQANLANIARDAGDHTEARRLYALLLEHLPNHPVVRRNYLTGLEYDPTVSDSERLRAAREWGSWLIGRAGGETRRPPFQPLHDRPLRVSYVSADFCQHTVGLFVKDGLK